MIAPLLQFVPCPDVADGHRMAYWQWGNPASDHVVVCVHGLSRQGRDFDALAHDLCTQAEVLQGGIRVICPDVVGRGESDWLANPALYQIPTYAADMLALLAQLHAQSPMAILDWVGTSMGGLIGLVVCGQQGLPLPVPVRRLVINDVGPALQWSAIARIGGYLGQGGLFASVEEAADALWAISPGFGPHSATQWLALSRPMLKPAADGNGALRLHYDPAIALPFRQATQASTVQGEAMLWQLYDQVTAKTLLLRGAQSDLLSRDTALAMTQRGPQAELVELAGVGHAPTLVARDQRSVVTRFLLG
jgi:pimeloyl-ACP methyl ester carboxylesterase